MRFFQRGEQADTKFIFLDDQTLEPIDVNDAAYRIVRYSGTSEIELVAETPLVHITGKVGHYVCYWDIPLSVPENETYFVYGTGTHPVTGTPTTLEDFYRVLPQNYFGGGGGSGGSGLTIKFTKP